MKKRSRILIAIAVFVAIGGVEVVGGGILLIGLAIVKARRPEQNQALMASAEQQIESFAVALETYRLEVGAFPSSSEGLEALRTRRGDPAQPHPQAGPYLAEPTRLDPWERAYRYEYPGKHGRPVPDVWSAGPDGASGTADDVVSW